MKKLTAKQIREKIPTMPFNQHLGMRLVKIHKDGLTIECALRPEFMNGAGVLHGGVTATMADAAAGISTFWALGGRQVTTVEMKLNYFRPIAKGKIRARAYLLRIGSRLVISRVDLMDDEDKLAGTALVTYMILGSR